MVVVEDRSSVLHVQVVVGAGAPGKIHHPVQIGADDPVLGSGRRQPLEPAELAVGGLLRLLGQPRILQPLPQLGDLGLLLVALAELLLDRPQLLAQVELALALVDPLLHLRLDPGAELDHLELAGEDLREPAQAGADVDLLEDLLLLGGRDPQRPRDQVRERGGVLDVGDGELQLLGQVGDLLDDLAEGPLDVAGQRSQLGAVLEHVGELGDLGDEIGAGRSEVVDADPLGPLDQDADGPVGNLQHPRDVAGYADPLELVGPGLLELWDRSRRPSPASGRRRGRRRSAGSIAPGPRRAG